MIHYILQVIAFQLVFLLIYDAFLKRETFFNCNRFYLLVTALLAFVLPFIELDAARQVVSQDFAIRLPEVIIGELSINESELANVENTTTASQTSKMGILPMLFWVGLLIAALFFRDKNYKIISAQRTQYNPMVWRCAYCKIAKKYSSVFIF